MHTRKPRARRTLAQTASALLLVGTTVAAFAAQEPMRFDATVEKKVSLGYLFFRPAGYDAQAGKRWPLILFLHGAGERGTNLDLVTVHGPPKIVKEKPDFPFILVSPQCPSGETWDADVLLRLLDSVIAAEAVDTNRVYLTGLSMGGYGTWSLGLGHPKRFAAIAPICGGGDPLRVRLAGGDRSARLKQLPVWAFHGAKDEVVRPEESERMVAALKALGNDARLTVYPEAGHDSWTETYANPALYDWFHSHSSAP